MTIATLSSKGQITIPQSVRTALGLHAGVKLDFLLDKDGFKVIPLHPKTSALKGRFAGRVAVAPTVEEMDTAIATQAAVRMNQLAS